MTLDELMDLLSVLKEVPGELDGLSELDHGLQCAFELESVNPDDHELQVAGLFHDIGHQFGSDDEHGTLGAERVRGAFGDRVASLVEGHVQAKRYLVTTDPSYGAALSETSVVTLGLQGGPMSSDELAAFAARPNFGDAVTLRRADDAAKVPGREVPGLDHWVPVIREVAR